MLVLRKKLKRPRRQGPEATLQKAVLEYLSHALPTTAFFSFFPLGGGGLFHGMRMRQLGARKGFPDLIVLYDGCAYCIELKSNKGVLQDSQRDCHAALQDARVPVQVCRSVADVQRFLRDDCGLYLRAVAQ